MSGDEFGRREILAGLGAGAALTLGSRARAQSVKHSPGHAAGEGA